MDFCEQVRGLLSESPVKPLRQPEGRRHRPRFPRLLQSETRYVCNTYPFNDYSRYDFNLFSEEEKRKHRLAHYDIDLQNAYELGKRLVEKAISPDN